MTIEDLPSNIRDNIKLFGDCWLWTGAVRDESRKHKQPIVYFNGKMYLTHRVTYHLATGFSLNEKLQINHKVNCNFSLCVNPEHLYIGTQADNIKDRDKSGHNRYALKTTCPIGHELSVSPTTGHRYCQICKNIRRDAWRKRNK